MGAMVIHELRLHFERSRETLCRRVTSSWSGGTSARRPFTPFLTADDEENLRWYLEDYMALPVAGDRIRAAGVERALVDWGRRLFAAVFDQSAERDQWRALLDTEGPRLLTIHTRDPDVLRVPWELLADDHGPLVGRGITIRRQL